MEQKLNEGGQETVSPGCGKNPQLSEIPRQGGKQSEAPTAFQKIRLCLRVNACETIIYATHQAGSRDQSSKLGSTVWLFLLTMFEKQHKQSRHLLILTWIYVDV